MDGEGQKRDKETKRQILMEVIRDTGKQISKYL